MIELAALATSIVSSFLVPLAKEGAKALRDRLAKKAGEASADKLVGTAETLWGRVKGSAAPGPEQSVLSTFEQNPELLKEALEKIVLDRLEKDEAFRTEATKLLEADAAPGMTSWQLMGDIVGAVDARGATISGGTVAGVVYHAPTADERGASATDPAATE
jgi:hypothetical protein